MDVFVAVDGEPRKTSRWPEDLFDRLRQAVELLEAVGAGVRAGDRLVTGSIVQVPVGPGEEVTATVGDQATIRLSIEPL